MKVATDGSVSDLRCDWCSILRQPEDYYAYQVFDGGTPFERRVRTTDSRCLNCRRNMAFKRRETR